MRFNHRFKYLQVFCICLVLGLLAACSPKFDWREQPAADNQVKVLYPAKPFEAKRVVEVAGHSLELTLKSAGVDGTVFAVGHAAIPPEVLKDPEQLERLAHAFEENLRVNIGGVMQPRTPPTLRLSANQNRTVHYASEFDVHGMIGKEPGWMRVKMLIVDDQLFEIIALGPDAVLTQDHVQTFMTSVAIN